MPKDEATNKLKLVHLVWMLMVLAIGLGVAWGTTINQQQTNTEAIKQKVEKDIFQMHAEQQKEQYQKMDKKLDTILKKI